jgi:hypothetical protein
MSIVTETVVPDNTVISTWVGTPPQNLLIDNGVDTPDDNDTINTNTVSRIATFGFAAPVGTGYDRISAAKWRIREKSDDDSFPPGLIVSLYNDGNLLNTSTFNIDTDRVYKVMYLSITGLDIAEADAGKFTITVVSLAGTGQPPPNYEN